MKLRRVVTGHDSSGKSIVLYDDLDRSTVSNRPGHSAAVLWQTGEFPADNDARGDAADQPVKLVNPNGTVFRVVRYEPGTSGRMHSTDSVDYAVLISGELDMELDHETVELKAGDCVVQRGTIHSWINRGREPCVIAFVLVAARPCVIAGAQRVATDQ